MAWNVASVRLHVLAVQASVSPTDKQTNLNKQAMMAQPAYTDKPFRSGVSQK